MITHPGHEGTGEPLCTRSKNGVRYAKMDQNRQIRFRGILAFAVYVWPTTSRWGRCGYKSHLLAVELCSSTPPILDVLKYELQDDHVALFLARGDILNVSKNHSDYSDVWNGAYDNDQTSKAAATSSMRAVAVERARMYKIPFLVEGPHFSSSKSPSSLNATKIYCNLQCLLRLGHNSKSELWV